MTAPSRQGGVIINAVLVDGQALYTRPVSAFRYPAGDLDPHPGEFAFTLPFPWMSGPGSGLGPGWGWDLLPVSTTLANFATLDRADVDVIDATDASRTEYYAKLRATLRPAGLVLSLLPTGSPSGSPLGSPSGSPLSLLTTGVGQVLNTSDTTIERGDLLVLRLPVIDGPLAPDPGKSRIYPGRLLLHGISPVSLLRSLHNTVTASRERLDIAFRLSDSMAALLAPRGPTVATAVASVVVTIGTVGRASSMTQHQFLQFLARTYGIHGIDSDKRSQLRSKFHDDVFENMIDILKGQASPSPSLKNLFRKGTKYKRPTINKLVSYVIRDCPPEAMGIFFRLSAPIYASNMVAVGRAVYNRDTAIIKAGAGGRMQEEDIDVPEGGINFVGVTAMDLSEKIAKFVAAATETYRTLVRKEEHRDGRVLRTALDMSLKTVAKSHPPVAALPNERATIVSLLVIKFADAFETVVFPEAAMPGLLARTVLSRDWMSSADVVGGTPVGRALSTGEPGGYLDAHVSLRTLV